MVGNFQFVEKLLHIRVLHIDYNDRQERLIFFKWNIFNSYCKILVNFDRPDTVDLDHFIC